MAKLTDKMFNRVIEGELEAQDEIISSVNQGIESGDISVEQPAVEIPMVTDDYDISVGTSEGYIAISEANDKFDELIKFVGKYLYGYHDETLVFKAQIIGVDTGNIAGFTILPQNLMEDLGINGAKIFTK